jgi:hypothetical protein
MKRCPTCNRTFTDENLIFCVDDGTPLGNVQPPPEEVTVVSPAQPYTPRDWTGADYQPPGSHVPPGARRKRRVWPWVVGILGILIVAVVGLGIVAAVMIPRMVRSAANRNTGTYNSNSIRNENANLNSNSGNSNSANRNNNQNTTPSSAPTDEAEVLVMLTDLENDWTVANINADKKKLDRILADDYVGMSNDGSSVGKPDYLKMITRDTVTQSWDFQDLKLDLKGDRATLTGVVLFRRSSGDARYKFTDKFVWRDRRWQATWSEVTPIN